MSPRNKLNKEIAKRATASITPKHASAPNVILHATRPTKKITFKE
jgi:hypothetical protein